MDAELVEQSERDDHIFKLRVSGVLPRALVAQFGLSVTEVNAIVEDRMIRVDNRFRASAAAIDLERLEEVIQVTLAKAKGGDVPSGHLLRTLLQRKAAMLGYDAPMRIDPVLVLDVGETPKTSTDRIAEVIERLCGRRRPEPPRSCPALNCGNLPVP